MAFAGGVYQKSSPKAYYYLTQNVASSIIEGGYWWTMSPNPYHFGNAGLFYVSVFTKTDSMRTQSTNAALFIRPVISLKSNIVVTGVM